MTAALPARQRRLSVVLFLAPILLLAFRLNDVFLASRAPVTSSRSRYASDLVSSQLYGTSRLQLTLCEARGGAAAGSLVALWRCDPPENREVIAGPPAAGKGTQCEKIKDKYGFVHISTGDILRENVKKGTELGKKAKGFMDSGAPGAKVVTLVPSELIVDLVKDRLLQDDVKEKGCLLDGFPRAPDQAQAMVDAGLDVEKFLVIKVPDDTLVERGCGRRLDPETGEIYHLKFRPPPEEAVDRLIHRSDDQDRRSWKAGEILTGG
ncbi:unnamed protein product [Cladocopium goreaui]|uniref:Probable adenylate kinase 2, chloroplastic (Adenylate monophosphate kinase 2) n=1 Tax=Cladocopium goreaui TaxID=2562237 RepID=A0A9P1GGK4_9DINO|nr:unnamed protein product [Cladocopium goreaui]